MTAKDIKQKALAKAAEILDNPGHWHSTSGALSASQAVTNLVYLGLAADAEEKPLEVASVVKAAAKQPKEKEDKPAE